MAEKVTFELVSPDRLLMSVEADSVAMPGMEDPRFQRTLIYMCAHSNQGAMGLVVNKVMENITFPKSFWRPRNHISSIEKQLKIYWPP